ncbi:MAG: hypothetical protein MJB14_06895 [Spirochaetes bacterium]|nr:hypothetical protein [Spirochaetota bacterium]
MLIVQVLKKVLTIFIIALLLGCSLKSGTHFIIFKNEQILLADPQKAATIEHFQKKIKSLNYDFKTISFNKFLDFPVLAEKTISENPYDIVFIDYYLTPFFSNNIYPVKNKPVKVLSYGPSLKLDQSKNPIFHVTFNKEQLFQTIDQVITSNYTDLEESQIAVLANKNYYIVRDYLEYLKENKKSYIVYDNSALKFNNFFPFLTNNQIQVAILFSFDNNMIISQALKEFENRIPKKPQNNETPDQFNKKKEEQKQQYEKYKQLLEDLSVLEVFTNIHYYYPNIQYKISFDDKKMLSEALASEEFKNFCKDKAVKESQNFIINDAITVIKNPSQRAIGD